MSKNELLFIPRNGGLWPGEEDAELMLRKLKPGVGIFLSYRRARNPQHHKRLMALINLVLKNTDRWANKDVLRQDLKLATGLCTIQVNQFNGMPYPVPSPIDFAAMPQDEFAAWYPKAVDKLADALGCTADELEAMLDESPQRRAA